MGQVLIQLVQFLRGYFGAKLDKWLGWTSGLALFATVPVTV